MANGLKIPVGVNALGRTATVSADTCATQTIMTALTDCDNENAFQQDLGLGSGMVFAVNDIKLRATILQRLREIFAQFVKERKYKLLEETISWDDTGEELRLDFHYLDMESDEEKPFQKIFRPED
jgi:hypothetical protein